MIFKGLSIKQITQIFLEGESLILSFLRENPNKMCFIELLQNFSPKFFIRTDSFVIHGSQKSTTNYHIALFHVDYIKDISVHIKETVNWISKEILLSKLLRQSALRISRMDGATLFFLIIW